MNYASDSVTLDADHTPTLAFLNVLTFYLRAVVRCYQLGSSFLSPSKLVLHYVNSGIADAKVAEVYEVLMGCVLYKFQHVRFLVVGTF